MATREKPPGKRALRAQVEARRGDLERRLADLLRALGLGAGSMRGVLELVEAGDEAATLKCLGQFAGKTEGDLRRIAEARSVAQEIAGLPKV